MGIPVSLVLIAVGAVLGLAVHPSGSHPVNVNTVGWILLAVGVFGLVLTMLFWDSWAGGRSFRRRGAYGAPPPGYGEAPAAPPAPGYAPRTTVVEEDDPPPAPPPY
ncbi:MAG: DUF6458 family protein [Gaiellaceae bacterium]